MELIRPSVEIWEQGNTLEDIWKHIARCTRVCYQSASNIKQGETAEEFVKRVILHNIKNMNTLSCNFEKLHGAMLEHGTVYLAIPISEWTSFEEYSYSYLFNPYSKVNDECVDWDNWEGIVYITTNLRVIYENDWLDDLKYICVPTEHHAKRVTVSFTTNIGVTREFNRHRVNSMAEESTRYCNYNKRNDGQIKIGLPAWLLDEEHLPYIESHQFDKLSSYCEEYLNDNSDINPECWCDMDFYLFALTVSEYCYNMLIKKGWAAQKAREVLPLATKSQLIHTTFVDDWKHFFALRADGVSGPPHPNAALVAKPLKEEFIKRGLL